MFQKGAIIIGSILITILTITIIINMFSAMDQSLEQYNTIIEVKNQLNNTSDSLLIAGIQARIDGETALYEEGSFTPYAVFGAILSLIYLKIS